MAHFLYVICEDIDEPAAVKIGFSAQPEKRLRQLQTGHSTTLRVFYTEEVEQEKVRGLERVLHKLLKRFNLRGEWFSLKPEDAVAEVRHAVIRYGDVDDLSRRICSGSIAL